MSFTTLTSKNITIEKDRLYPEFNNVVVNGMTQSSVHFKDPAVLHPGHWSTIGAVLNTLNLNTYKEVIHFGAAGMSIPRFLFEKHSSINQTVVDYDKELVEYVLQKFPLNNSANVDIIYGDAKEVISSNLIVKNKTFDIVFSDIYNEDTPASYASSKEYLWSLKKLLNTDGVLIMNILDYSILRTPSEPFSESLKISALLKQEFEQVILLIDDKDITFRHFGNVILVASTSKVCDKILSDIKPSNEKILQAIIFNE